MRCGTISKRLVSKVIVGTPRQEADPLIQANHLIFLRWKRPFIIASLVLSAAGLIQHSSPDSNVPAVQRMETARKARAKTGGPAETGGPAKSGNPAKVAK